MHLPYTRKELREAVDAIETVLDQHEKLQRSFKHQQFKHQQQIQQQQQALAQALSSK